MSASCGRRGTVHSLAIDAPNTVSVDRAEIWLARVNRAAKKDRPQEDGAEVDDYRRNPSTRHTSGDPAGGRQVSGGTCSPA